MAPLFEINRAQFFSLQLARGAERVVTDAFHSKLVDLTEHIRDFSDTAALLENLDLIISVDTAVAHLAGALGKRVWTLIPFSPDWRWLLDREDSPWYPTMRLYRQPKPGDWETVVQRVKNDLQSLAEVII
jgi:ADP-heptose:LPS heptosyltransferase